MMRNRTDAGVTLLELVVVLAIFSVLSLMGVQLLSQAMANRDAVAHTDGRVSALSTAVAVLRRDLEQAIPEPDASGEIPFFAISGDGLRVVSATDAGTAAVFWQIDAGKSRLLRRRQDNGEVTVALDQVNAMRIDVFEGADWADGATWRPTGPADLPRGLRVVLSLADLGDVPIVVAR